MASQADRRQHCCRVAALAVEIARRLGLAQGEQQLAEHAALMHHHPPEMLDMNTLGRLLSSLPASNPAAVPRADSRARCYFDDLLNVLRTFHSNSCRITDSRLFTLVDVVATSHLYVEQLESARSDGDPNVMVLEKLRWKVEQGLCRPAVLKAIDTFPRIRSDELREAISGLPVYPAIALRVLALASDDDVTFGQLEPVISSDQVLAGRLVSMANSWIYSPRYHVSTIRQAISYIGIDTTRKLAAAAAFRPLFSSASLHDLWKHSLEVARVCERLATSAHGVNREEAFLAGLVHDIGRLTISRLPGARAAYGRLLEKGCEPVIAELFLLGCDHGETGAEVLRLWDFPVHLVDAVANHHQPENARNQLALLLHLAESRCAPEESMPSPVLRGAMDKVGVAPDFLESMDNGVGELECLVGVA